MKRLMDILGAMAGLLLLAPVIVLLSLLVRIKLGSPVLFRQTRPGRAGQAFQMAKFRTMTDARDANGELLPDAERLTGFGQFLRSSSLDELPELWNVLKGDMSLVGPRPLLMEYLPLYTERQARRHEVRPGITGWAQVKGYRGETDTLEKMEARVNYDTYYVENWSLFFDLQILVMTVFVGFVNKNAY